MRFQSARIVLRNENPRQATIDLLSGRLGPTEARRHSEPESSLTTVEIVWRINDDVELHYLEDANSKAGFTVTTGEDREGVAEWASMASAYIGAWTDKELLDGVTGATDSGVRSHLLLLAGLGSPGDFDDRFFSVISDEFDNADPLVRMGAVWASSYSAWKEYLPKLRSLAAHDPEPDIRNVAQSFVDIIDVRHVRPAK
ncbi:HEAT repeat domain-containing protein [Streptomyces sp. NBC_01508]|uniref:HEAT repeat domain-containing protein n=1 Tax=Streptomyces sp. NBC_01508 TaxID=2903888 RepID=UPI003864357B